MQSEESIVLAKLAKEKRFESVRSGTVHQIWACADRRGKIQLKEFIKCLSSDNIAKSFRLFDMICDNGLPKSDEKFKILDAPVFELKLWGIRYIGFPFGRNLVLTNGLEKKTSKSSKAIQSEVASAHSIREELLTFTKKAKK